MPEFQFVEYEVAEQICTIKLNRPDALNAMNSTLVRETGDAFEKANLDPSIRVIVFTGNGQAFCAGDDRNEHIHPETTEQAKEFVESIQRVTRNILFGEKLVVGAINGWAVGGGFEWAINCDFSIWAESAKAFFPEVSLNLFVTGGVTSLLPALAGLNKAREMLFLGDHYTATELYESNVAWKVVADEVLLTQADNLANRLARLPVRSAREMKRVLYLTSSNDIAHALDLETDATINGFMDPETTRFLKNGF